MDSEYAKGFETLQKSDRQSFSNISLSLSKKMSWKIFVLGVSETLRLFVNILRPDDQYILLSKNECLIKPIQMLLCRNEKIFSWFFSAFAESTSNFEYFETKDEPGRVILSEIIDYKKRCYLKAEKAAYQNTYGPSRC